MEPLEPVRSITVIRSTRATLGYCLIAVMSFCALTSADAASILWVDCVNTTSNAGDGRPPSAGWLDLLETTGGHTVTTFDSSTYQWSLADQASKDYVNSFDVVIVTRTNNAFNTIRAFGANWKTVSAPMIEMNPYMVGGQSSSGSWSWLASGAGNSNTGGGTAVPTNVADPADPIWNGVTLLLNDTQASNLFAMASGNWFVQNGNPLRSGISVVASNPADSTMILIAYAEPGALSATSGPRYYINWGSDNTTMNYNDDGKKVFLNAIAVLTGGFAPDGPIPLKITKNPNTPGTFDFEWPSRSGKLYDLLTSTDLADPVAEWPVYDDGQTLYEAIPPAGETTTLAAVPSADPRRFFAIREFDSLPPPPLLFSDFEDGDGGFTVTTTAGTAWVWGAPNSNDNGGTPNPGGSVTAGNSGSLKCWGSGIGNPGFYLVPTSSTLSSPVIDLTEVGAAELSFHEALDLETNDTARVFLVNADTGADIGGAIHTAIDTANSTAQWAKVSPINISAGAGHRVRIEWRFNGQGSSADYLGWYIDDVMVIATP